MSNAVCFAPVEEADAVILILGSMPGQESLTQQQYYAHPRNAFWPIIAEITGFVSDIPYADRVRLLPQHGIALWDVLQSCFRPGSLDASIDEASIIANDFQRFFAAHPAVRLVVFNGGKAYQAYQKHVLPGLPDCYRQIERLKLPSTSPANARMNMAEKLDAWLEIRGYL
ncbi:MAG: DNA-deoxyinosine glycosylase [Gammaproteobacteria bacterium]